MMRARTLAHPTRRPPHGAHAPRSQRPRAPLTAPLTPSPPQENCDGPRSEQLRLRLQAALPAGPADHALRHRTEVLGTCGRCGGGHKTFSPGCPLLRSAGARSMEDSREEQERFFCILCEGSGHVNSNCPMPATFRRAARPMDAPRGGERPFRPPHPLDAPSPFRSEPPPMPPPPVFREEGRGHGDARPAAPRAGGGGGMLTLPPPDDYAEPHHHARRPSVDEERWAPRVKPRF